MHEKTRVVGGTSAPLGFLDFPDFDFTFFYQELSSILYCLALSELCSKDLKCCDFKKQKIAGGQALVFYMSSVIFLSHFPSLYVVAKTERM